MALREYVLVLQLRILAAAVVRLCGAGLVAASPFRPSDDEGNFGDRLEQQACKQSADFGNAWDASGDPTKAERASGLFSFALLPAACRNWAANLARKAAAAIQSVMLRCQPCQERASQRSRPNSSFARWKHSSIVQRKPAAPASSASSDPAGANTR
jgi:hypothetical protein